MIQYRIYLLAELGKFTNRGDVDNFFDYFGKENVNLKDFFLDSSFPELQKVFSSLSSINEYLSRLSNEQIKELARLCSECRENGVYRKFEKYEKWIQKDIDIEMVDLSDAESELKDIFRKFDYKLVDLLEPIKDKKPYCSFKVGNKVEMKTCLAVSNKDRYKIFDGVHRAYQLALNGEKKINLCVPKPI